MDNSQKAQFDKGYQAANTIGSYTFGFVSSCVVTYASAGALSNVNITMGYLLLNEISLMGAQTAMATNAIGAYGEIMGKTELVCEVSVRF